MILLSTVHGSHLYGLAHANSDKDRFEVHTNKPRIGTRWAEQLITGSDDIVRTDLSTFLADCNKGVPQRLEAMYSRKPDIDELGERYRLSYRPNYAQALYTYERTIRKLWMKGVELDDIKFKRHAWRLEGNRLSIANNEAFDPELSNEDKRYINRLILSGRVPPSVTDRMELNK